MYDIKWNSRGGAFLRLCPWSFGFFCSKINFLDELNYLMDLISISREQTIIHHWIKAEIVEKFDKRNKFNSIKCLGTSLFRLSRHFLIRHVAFKRNHLSSYLMRVVLSNSASISLKATLTSDIQMYTSLSWDEKLSFPWINNSRAIANFFECNPEYKSEFPQFEVI